MEGVQMNSQEINASIKANASLSYAEIGNIVGLPSDAVRKRYRKLGLPAKRSNSQNRALSPLKEIERDVAVQALSKKFKGADAKYKILQEQLAEAVALNQALKAVGDENCYTIPTKKHQGKNMATAVAVASDWHWAETVHPENVNDLNKFTLNVAHSRAEKFFQNVVRLCQHFGRDSQIDTLVLALLGDFINGQLREEAMENNSLRPMDEMIQAWKVLAGGINYILDNTDLNLVIPCHSGNHARVTKKIHWSTESGNSLEYAMYHVLASEFSECKRVKFIIPTSYHSFLDIAGYTIRFHHGHTIKYGGGIGGIFVPAFKAISQWQKARHADLDVFGHFHQSKDGGNFLCNGSLIGLNEFAVAIKADFEKPKQTFFLIDHKRKEKTVTTSIFLD